MFKAESILLSGKKWGGQIAVDDYGSGYNGASVLLHVVPDILKVDISIIHHVNQKADNLKILESIISYARHQGIKVLAEGVESREEVEACIAAGVDMLQGYYVGKTRLRNNPSLKTGIAEYCRYKKIVSENVLTKKVPHKCYLCRTFFVLFGVN